MKSIIVIPMPGAGVGLDGRYEVTRRLRDWWKIPGLRIETWGTHIGLLMGKKAGPSTAVGMTIILYVSAALIPG